MCRKGSKLLVIVGLTGKRRAGKDTSADILKRAILNSTNQQSWVQKHSIGYFSKKCYAEQAGIDLQKLVSDDRFKEYHREGIVSVSLEKRHLHGVNYWVEQCYNSFIEEFANSHHSRGFSLLSDIRFCSEIDFLKHQAVSQSNTRGVDLQPLFVRVSASDTIRSDRGWSYNHVVDSGQPEVELDNYKHWDYVIENHTNSLDDLAEQLQIIENDLRLVRK